MEQRSRRRLADWPQLSLAGGLAGSLGTAEGVCLLGSYGGARWIHVEALDVKTAATPQVQVKFKQARDGMVQAAQMAEARSIASRKAIQALIRACVQGRFGQCFTAQSGISGSDRDTRSPRGVALHGFCTRSCGVVSVNSEQAPSPAGALSHLLPAYILHTHILYMCMRRWHSLPPLANPRQPPDRNSDPHCISAALHLADARRNNF